ncbi:hypothetical protein [Escherichia coli]|uniref:hypothetical protein n=1 Tax=Escherichia coli TaxID=562 RepID=UPI0004D34EDA|nr:hypothetical protein [Escherichia coli]KEM76135.1 hypothetical protein AC11_2283 [Escherichia coli 6-537-08_S3_C1]KEM83017.1 hypothetical protein AC64_2286 [Escherichia coli 6-537-08_S3_C3]KEN17367.1 hypothetical protein AC39_2372 [Escherichia coli 6-537-08_S3_C2]MBN6582306.1 hypothetical protein [Escherichia coli]HBC1359834.1 hypothetical protein [Escherichia coli]
MNINATPVLITLVYEALLRSFWRKPALKKFLLSSHISESFISTWREDESKRNFLDRLFPKLQSSAKGKNVICHMAVNLSEQTSFPDLKGWEDSLQMIQSATDAIKDLKNYITKQNEEHQTEKEKQEFRARAEKERTEIKRSETDLIKLKNEFECLHNEIGTQNGGYAFEKWFFKLVDYCEIVCKKPYKTNGRQVDGAIIIDGTTYLVELKFQKTQADAIDIDSLKAKVSKMADNTMAVMISVSGYSSVAITESSGSRTPLLLLDYSHLYLFLSGGMRFDEIITRIRRHSSQTGESYLSVNSFGGF